MSDTLYQDISVDDANLALAQCQVRVCVRMGQFGEQMVPLILYCGKWLEVCRTDRDDNVTTGVIRTRTGEYERDPIAYYRNRIRLGARITDKRFAVIDAFSDG